jgi:hypothetical protein
MYSLLAGDRMGMVRVSSACSAIVHIIIMAVAIIFMPQIIPCKKKLKNIKKTLARYNALWYILRRYPK